MKASEQLVKNKGMTTSSSVKKFTDTLVSQSSLMQRLLTKKGGLKRKNMFKEQIQNKFDKLFNYNSKSEKDINLKPLRLKHGPKLYLSKPHVIQTK
jgi:hypothetical protein